MEVIASPKSTSRVSDETVGRMSFVRRLPERPAAAAPSLNGRAALIVDGGWGIGRAVAIDFAQRGAAIAFGDQCEPIYQEHTRTVLESFGVDVLPVARPEDSEAGCRRLVSEVHDRFGCIDVLVYAAPFSGEVPLHRMHGCNWNELMHGYLDSAYHLARAVINPMRQRGHGRIIFISDPVTADTLSEHPRPRIGQAGMIGLAQTLARENAPRGVTVNCVSPGVIAPPKTLEERADHPESIGRSIPMRRIGRPEDVAHLVSFLASEQADYITGQLIHVDGGLSA